VPSLSCPAFCIGGLQKPVQKTVRHTIPQSSRFYQILPAAPDLKQEAGACHHFPVTPFASEACKSRAGKMTGTPSRKNNP